ncbi:MAG: biopolymer transporter ExbD [Gammaproteobacteria bacterium]|nr:MAG: biopolymer transporter ExbD [Gammaproteobacteria bacterium]
MNFGRSRRDGEGVNLTPLIDVVFILLIFFMVTTTFQREAALAVSLPQASPEPEQAPPDVLEVTIGAEGKVYVGGRELVDGRLATVKRALQEMAAGRKDRPLVIRADARTAHQNVVTVMDAAAQLGIAHVSIVTTPVGATP